LLLRDAEQQQRRRRVLRRHRKRAFFSRLAAFCELNEADFLFLAYFKLL
jgi:hypothetical protein